jgi:hypothetical protein
MLKGRCKETQFGRRFDVLGRGKAIQNELSLISLYRGCTRGGFK